MLRGQLTCTAVALFQVGDGIAQPSTGVLRACGRQDIGAAASLVAFYVLGLPTGYVLGFKFGFGLPGLWFGNAVCLWAVGLIQSVRARRIASSSLTQIYVSRMDFAREADLAAKRNEVEEPDVTAA